MSSPDVRDLAPGPASVAGADAAARRSKARALGQVFTPEAVADLIASLSIHHPDATLFDPCVGEGALVIAAGRRLAALGTRDWHRQVGGLELDAETWSAGREHIAAAAGVAPESVRIAVGDFLMLPPPSAGSQRALDLGCGGAPAVAAAAYDVVVMNPPYTRQEHLAPRCKGGWQGSPGVSRRAGLHVHFWVHLERFLRQGGWLGAITSATWLSAAYGRELRAFLLERFRIHFLIQFERDVFPNAQVDACVAILEKRDGGEHAGERGATPVRFLHLSAGHRLVEAAAQAASLPGDGEGAGFRVQVLPQAALAHEGRWSRFFTAPAAAGAVSLSTRAAQTLPLESLAHIRRGLTTGSNRVFLMDPGRASRLGIEERFLRQIVRSPREIPGLDTEAVERPGLVLLPAAASEGTRAAAYLQEMGVAGSAYLPVEAPDPAPLLFGYAVRARKAFFRNSAGLLAGDNFFELTPRRPGNLDLLFALLNAVPTALLLETQGRGQGRGLLKIQRYELAALSLPDPERMDPGLRREIEALGGALRLSPTDGAAREALDQAAARALGLDAADLRRAEHDLAGSREARAFSHGITRNSGAT